jgi:hypothetical protein
MVAVVCWVCPPPVPEIVNVEVPWLCLAVLTVSVDVPPPPVNELGLKLKPARFGRPVTLRLTVPVKPEAGVTVTE